MKKKLAVLGLTAALTLGVAAPAQAHYDPWETHQHWNDTGVYVSCSVWDELFNGCANRYIVVWWW